MMKPGRDVPAHEFSRKSIVAMGRAILAFEEFLAELCEASHETRMTVAMAINAKVVDIRSKRRHREAQELVK